MCNQDISLPFLEKILSVASPSGAEWNFAKMLGEELKSFSSQHIDNLSNLICTIGEKDSSPIMLEAHIDEVGMQVSTITDDGFVYCRRNGSIDGQTLLGSNVTIHSRNGDVDGVIGKKPIHLEGDIAGKPVIVEDLWIDIFAENGAEAKENISIGDYVTFKNNFKVCDNRIMSKGLDNKIGVFVVSETLKQLSKEIINKQIVACFCAQEEVGSRGAIVASNSVRPEYAICVDVGFATDYPGMSEPKYGNICLGKGPVINMNCDNNRDLVELIVETARANSIPYQLYTNLAATGGSDTSVIQLSNNGVRTALISIPCRYMHTPVEVCDLRDVSGCIELIVQTVLQIANR